MTHSRLLTTKEAAMYLGVSTAFLERDRWAGATIPFVKIGARAVRYDLRVLDGYIKSRVRRSTSDTGEVTNG
jgi:hypothetical protein